MVSAFAHAKNLPISKLMIIMASKKSFSLLSLLVLVFVVYSDINQCSVAATASLKSPEAEALLNWKGSLFQSQALNSWSLNVSLCNWTGITCNGAKEEVTEINLPNYGLQGTLDQLSFSSFQSLVRLDLTNNTLNGTIPSHIGALSRLAYLDLSKNQLLGTLPLSLANLTLISDFNISDNILTGRGGQPLAAVAKSGISDRYCGCNREERDETEVDDMSEADPMIAMLNDIAYGLAPEYTSCETEGVGGSNSRFVADEEALRYFEILDDAQIELYPGCKDFSKLSFIVELLHLKALNQWSETSFDMLLQLLHRVLPPGMRMPILIRALSVRLRDGSWTGLITIVRIVLQVLSIVANMWQ
ncbi:hypothetical protein MRB53_035068 [Persea americana]|uniref:Uncharacterized protein n=1 Tax=Persea americana TaxID=3435 RepID=A0ACC2K3R5_PERAE|nr:hypothetical protein MRB53_035068 [Persea americana]